MKLFIVLMSITLFALGQSAWADAEAGKAVYDSKCKLCHGAEGKGNPMLAKTLKVEFRDLGSKEVQAQSDEELKNAITQGTGKMKPVKGLSDQQVEDVIAFVRSLAKS